MLELSAAEIAAARAATPGCVNVIHFNHAGASLMPTTVIEATVNHLHREAEIGAYEAADEADDRLEAGYDSIARLIHAKPDEIAIVENATRAWDMAFYAVPLKDGDRILTSASEYGSNVISFLQLAGRGVSVEVIPNDIHGQVSVDALANMLDDRVKVVAITHMPTNGGLTQPAAEIGKVVKQSSALYLLDACQTVGQMPIDVEAIGCDALSATSRKYVRGPRGVGFLYVREPWIQRLTPPFLDIQAATWVARDRIKIRPDARRFENWESFVAGRLGMGAAVEYALSIGMDRIWTTVRRRATQLRIKLSDVPGVTVRDLGEIQGGIVTFTVDGLDPEAIKAALAREKINVTTSSVFSTRYDMEDRGLAKLVRASVHYLTTTDEIDQLVRVVAALPRTR